MQYNNISLLSKHILHKANKTKNRTTNDATLKAWLMVGAASSIQS